ncbi:apolipoprotein E-like [Haliaeetus albicilla]|uniref:apolipoprotein E-like n=1 Tax=Haliaeetus albicilla TaxID=8969 RepID=UPI0037E76B1F
MKFWVVLVAATLLAGCGAELPPPEAAPPPGSRIWGYLGVLGEAAENATARLRGVPLVQKLQVLARELGSQASALSERLRAEAWEARSRAWEYGSEARSALEQSWGELKNRGAAYGRKLRKRLNRDGEELRRRWDAYSQAIGDGVASLRRSWRGGEGVSGDPGAPPVAES